MGYMEEFFNYTPRFGGLKRVSGNYDVGDLCNGTLVKNLGKRGFVGF